jgi:hypothetical protein
LVVSQILIDALEEMSPQYPKTDVDGIVVE